MRTLTIVLAFPVAFLLAAGLAPPPAHAAFGSPVVARGRIELGLVTRQYTRDIYDVEEDRLSNPEDTFGYTALEALLGLHAERLELGFLVGRAHNKQDRFPDRDYMTWHIGLSLRSRLYADPSGRWDVIAGGQYREAIGFDRSASQTHKLERNYVAHVTFGRLLAVAERPLRVYGGVLYSKHTFDEYGESYSPVKGAAEGETRKDLEALGGASLGLLPRLAAAGEVEYRESLSFALSAGYAF